MLHTKFQPIIPSHFGDMDLTTRVDVNIFRVDVNFSNGHCALIPLQIFFILIKIDIKVLLMLHTKFQPNIPSHFGEMDLNAWVDVNFLRVDVNVQTAILT